MVRIAVVGYGYWGPNLVRNLRQTTGAEVVCCCDASPPRLAEAGRAYPDLVLTPRYEDILADPSVDAIVIATPVRSHAGLARDALLHGKHVLVEKPLATTSAECEELVGLAERRGLVLMVGHTFLYSPAVRALARLVADGVLGHVRYIYAQRTNLGRVQRDVGAAWSLAPHDISILLHLLGELPLEVSAQGAAYLTAGVEDVTFLTMRFRNGVMAHVHVGWLGAVKVRRMSVMGSERIVEYDDVHSEDTLRVYDSGVDLLAEGPPRIRRGDIHVPRVSGPEPLAAECADFVACVAEGGRPVSDGRNGWDVVRVLEAAQTSLQQGGVPVSVVGVDLEPFAPRVPWQRDVSRPSQTPAR